MIEQLGLFDVAELETPLSFVATCHRCGQHGDPIPVEGGAGASWNAAALWAYLELREHEQHCPAST